MQVDKLSVKILNVEACAVDGGAATKLMFLLWLSLDREVIIFWHVFIMPWWNELPYFNFRWWL